MHIKEKLVCAGKQFGAMMSTAPSMVSSPSMAITTVSIILVFQLKIEQGRLCIAGLALVCICLRDTIFRGVYETPCSSKAHEVISEIENCSWERHLSTLNFQTTVNIVN